MFEKSTALFGNTRLEVRLLLPSRERRSVEEGNDLVEKTDVAGDFKVVNNHVRQP
jgi:hypothetical protein